MPEPTTPSRSARPVCATPWGPGSIPTVACPHCGCALQIRSFRFPLNTLLIAASLLAPLAALVVLHRNTEATILIAFGLAPGMALASGVVLGLRIGKSVTGKLGLACIISIFLCMGSELTLAAGCASLNR
ncbi:MAG: hypothetical protein U1G08_06815 [Verrucomicrobiota bacterium]